MQGGSPLPKGELSRKRISFLQKPSQEREATGVMGEKEHLLQEKDPTAEKPVVRDSSRRQRSPSTKKLVT